MTLLQQLDVFFSLTNGLVFALVCMFLLLVVELCKPKQVITHYQRTDMVDMSLSVTDYMVFLKAGDIKGEWKPVFNGKFLPLDTGVLEAHLAAQAELDARDADYAEMCAAYAEEAEAYYSNSVVPVVGYCLCNKPFNFTTTKDASQNIKFLDMIACSHCSVCNPTIEVVDEQIDGERVTFTFSDGSTAVMREHKGWGSTRHLDAPSEGGYHVRLDNDSQMDAINRYTGSECIPF